MSQMLPDRVKEIEELLILMHEPASLDALVRVGEGEKPLYDLIPGDDGRTVINDIHRQSLSRALSEYLAQLTENQRTVVQRVYIDEESRLEVAERLGIDSSKLRQIELGALRTLRGKMKYDRRFVDYSR